MVGEKFTTFTIIAIVLMTIGSALLGIGNMSGSKKVVGTLDHNYLAGFFVALLTSALTGFMLPCSEYAYAKTKTKEPISYSVVLQFIVGNSFASTIFATVWMLINKDFQAIPEEASDFGLGPTMYYVILVLSALVWPMVTLGKFGLVFRKSALFYRIFGALMLPAVEFAVELAFHEFTKEKVVSLAFGLAGIAAYLYGIYREKYEKRIAHSHRSREESASSGDSDDEEGSDSDVEQGSDFDDDFE